MKHLRTLLFLPLALQSVLAEAATDAWQFSLTPYLWLPTIEGRLNYSIPGDGGNGDGGAAVGVGPTDWLDLLNGALLLKGEARRDRFLVFADIIYLGLDSDNDKILSVFPGSGGRLPVDASANLKTQTDIDGFTMTLAGGYNFHRDDRSSVDVFAGARYFDMQAKTRWNLAADIALPGGGRILNRQGSVNGSQEFWDAVVGIKGGNKIGSGNWSLSYYLDVGTGDADLTWQALAGASYAYGWGDVIISYRHFEYDLGPEGLAEDFSFSGPMLGARFSF